MEIAVLVKVVAPADSMRHDPERRTAIREAATMFLNPFDQRALRTGLELRRPGERLTVLSLGPPGVGTALREALHVGADRVLHLADPRFAGSDTLATARALVCGLARVGHQLVLCGRSSTDSDTGQVGPEVAGLLGVPVISSARRIQREIGGDGLTVVGETEDGTATYHVSPPAVVSVGEKISKPLRPTPEEVAAANDRSVERWTLDDIGLAPEHAGDAGSPTEVIALRDAAPPRRPQIFDTGPVSERVERAVRAISGISTNVPAPPIIGLLPLLPPLAAHDEAWVLVTGSDGRLEPESLSLVAAVRQNLAPLWPSAVWIGPPPTLADGQAVDRAGAVLGYRVPVDPDRLTSRSAALALHALLADRPGSAAGLFVSDTFGREVAGQLAARAALGLTGDAIGAGLDDSGSLLWSKPSFGGSVIATIRSRTRPSLATVRPGAFEPAPPSVDRSEIAWEERSFDAPTSSVRLVERRSEADPEYGDLARAQTIVCVGRGIGGPEEIRSLVGLLGRLGAALAATRKVVDAGWVGRHRQAGLTGRLLAPRRVILVGVGGSPNHLIAWRRAGTVIAINSDPAAPVFRECDVGIVGPWREVLDDLAGSLTPIPRGPTG